MKYDCYAMPWDYNNGYWYRDIYSIRNKSPSLLWYFCSMMSGGYYCGNLNKTYNSCKEAQQEIDFHLISHNVKILNTTEEVNRYKLLI